MEWINQQHIQNGDSSDIANMTVPFLAKLGVTITPNDVKLISAVKTRQSKARNLVEMAESILFYFLDDDKIEYEQSAKEKFLRPEDQKRLRDLTVVLSGVSEWKEESLQSAVNGYLASSGLQLKDIAQPCRTALTGSKNGPGLYEMLAVLGASSSVARLKRASAV